MRTDTIQTLDLQEGGLLAPLIDDPRPAFVWSAKSPRLLWANTAGQVLLGNLASTVESDEPTAEARSLWTELVALSPPPSGGLRLGRLRLPGKTSSEPPTCAVRVIPTRSDSAMLVVVMQPARSEQDAPSGEVAIPQTEPHSRAGDTWSWVEPGSRHLSTKTASIASDEGQALPIRWTFRTDAALRFTFISRELNLALGDAAHTWLGRSWTEIAGALGIKSQEIEQAFASHETWSGLMADWFDQAGNRRLQVTMSALPALDRNHVFQGFRGFGLCRWAVRRSKDVAQSSTAAPSSAESIGNIAQGFARDSSLQDPRFQDRSESQSSADVSIKQDAMSSKVVQLHPSSTPTSRNGLSSSEKSAFREIARALGARIEEGNASLHPVQTSTEEALSAAPFSPSIQSKEALVAGPSEILPAPLEERPQQTFQPTFMQAPPGGPVMAAPPADNDDKKMLGDKTTLDEQDGAQNVDQDFHKAGDLIRTIRLQLEHAEKSLARLPTLAGLAEMPGRGASTDLIDRLPVGVIVAKGERLIFVNRTLLDLLSYPDIAAIEEAGGLDHLFAGQGMAGPTSDGNSADGVLLTRADGETMSVEGRLQTIVWEGETALLMSARPMQDDGKAQALKAEQSAALAMQKAEELQAVLDTATDGVVIVDGEARIVGMNRSAEALFGYEAEHLVGQSLLLLFAPASHRAAVDYISSLQTGGVTSLLSDGRDVLGRVRQGGFVPLFMTMGRLGEASANRFCAVLRDATPFKKAEEDLASARRRAEEAVSQKSDVLEAIQQEVRKPLSNVVSLAQAIGEECFGPIGDERYKAYATDIQTAGRQMISLFDDLVDLNRIEAGKRDLVFTSVNLNQAVRDSVASIQIHAARERIIVRSALAETLPNVVADERSVRQIALNLLSHAVKFATRGGQIIVSTSLSEQGEAVLRIRDTGLGMTDAELAEALQPFPRPSLRGSDEEDARAGQGLGLPLTKALVEANRASFHIHSANNSGTIAEVVFPPTRVLAE